MVGPTRLILVRHGESLWNLEGRFTGWADVDLTDYCVTQMRSEDVPRLEVANATPIVYDLGARLQPLRKEVREVAHGRTSEIL